MAHDLRYALRQLRLAPVFTLTAVITLALGIGANTAIFTLVHGILLRSLPVASPTELYRIGDTDDCCVGGGFQGNNGDFDLFSYELYLDLKEAAPEFTQLAAVEAGQDRYSVRQGTEPARELRGELVSGNYFSTLGLGAFAGRLLQASDDQPAAAPVVVLSYRAWESDFGGARGILGSTLSIQTQPFTVIGIAPRGFFGDRVSDIPPEFWMPLSAQPRFGEANSLLTQGDAHWLYPLGRVRPGTSIPALQAKLSAALRHWLASRVRYTSNGGAAIIPKQHVVLTAGGGGIQNLQQETGSGLKLLMLLSLVVLLIACANIANMLLARSTTRRSEIALRMALGEGRGRLIRRILTESTLLGCLGGAAGLGVAYLGAHTILMLAFPEAKNSPIDANPSAAVLAFAFLVSLLTGVLFGLAPAWLASRAEPAEALRGANRSSGDRSSLPQNALVVFQAALSLVLVASALLMSQSLGNLEHQNFGVATAHRYVLHFDPAGAGYTADRLPALDRQLEDRFAALAGGAKVGLALYSPLEGDNWGECVIQEGHAAPGPNDRCESSWDRVSPQFLDAIGVPIVRGRGLSEQDTATSPQVAVVNETFAKEFFPHEDAVGQHFGLDDPEYSNSFEIVGVFRDFKLNNPREAVRAVFLRPMTQTFAYKDARMQQVETASLFANSILVDFEHPPADASGLMRRTLTEIDPNLTVEDLRTFGAQVTGNFNQDRLLANLSGLFGILALLLASVGLYGVTAYLVARRRSEIGIRMALGATRGRVVKMVLRGVLAQIGVGVAVGVPAAIMAAHLMASQMYDVGGSDARVLAGAALALAVCAAAAGLIPARRAASIDPNQTLRAE